MYRYSHRKLYVLALSPHVHKRRESVLCTVTKTTCKGIQDRMGSEKTVYPVGWDCPGSSQGGNCILQSSAILNIFPFFANVNN